MSKKYAFFHQKNGVYLGSQFFDYEPKGSDFGHEGAFVVSVKNDFDGSPCKYDGVSKKIVGLTVEENDKLLNESRLTQEEFQLSILQQNYDEAQNLFIQTQTNLFVIPLKSNKGYDIFKEKVVCANLYGSADFLCFDKKSQSMQILSGLTKEQWLQIGKKAEEIATKNYIQYHLIQEKILAKTSDVDFSFPEVETIKI
jgi:hypothetical protein